MKSIGRVVLAALVIGACASGPGDSGNRATALHGIVFDGGGAALPGVAVRVDPATGRNEPSLVYSDVRGRFVVAEVAHGRVTIVAEKAGYEAVRTEAVFLDATQIVYLRMRSARELVAEAERLLAAGRPTTATERARRALDIDPEDPTVRYACAAVAVRAGVYDEARAMLAWFAQHDPPPAVAMLRDLIAREGSK